MPTHSWDRNQVWSSSRAMSTCFRQGGPVDIGLGQALGEMDHLLLEVRPPAIELMEEGVDGVEVRAQAGVEVTQILRLDLGAELIQDVVQEGVGDLLVHGR
jgi:hypothetical protein